MIKIWSMKKNEDAAARKKPKTSAAQIRVQKDLTELDLPPTMKTYFPDPTDLLNFTLTITPDEGMYKGGAFNFSFQINNNYPHEPPKVKCTQTIYHPNVDLEGNVCLNILREDWKPVLNLNSVMVGLQYLFLEPNADDPLNKGRGGKRTAAESRAIFDYLYELVVTMKPTKLSKKQQKALAFRERKGKGKAKAADLEENAVPVVENPDDVEAGMEARDVEGQDGGQEESETHAEVVESKKRKRQSEEGQDEGTKKTKKKRKGASVGEDEGTEAVEEGETKSSNKERAKQQRFILFVGNLKYSTTKEAVEAHFSSCDPPPTVRLMTPKSSTNGKATSKSKGYAFLEFTNKLGLQQALKLHQSELHGRMINVELTAGGGGKGEGRLKKLKERNKELYEQRKKRLEKQKSNHDAETGVKDLQRPQRYSSTSGVDQAPATKRTWSVPDEKDEQPKKKKRGSKKPPRSLGTGVNAIPVG
ncbi:hypothetical protein NM688_g2703 [Phlebia brevispora]|uniref:Uncharacterized protein n=1 Tax=Phlebia brevispora TaxID=194682 RepID=A0ACC1T7M7_9APHY|nr:hypothetical protein NM688_g2703 [Phlebia brevispora]